MKKCRPAIILIMILIGLSVIGCAQQPKSEMESEEAISKLETTPKEKIGLTLISVYDNYQINPELKTGWGFSCLVKTEREDILFETGGNSGILLFNMKKMEIDPESINKVVISHIHGDHVGGLEGFLIESNEAEVYIPVSFPDSIRNMIESHGANFIDVSGTLKISDLVWSTGALYGPPEEQSLVINSGKGLIVITGCAHPGVVNIVKKAKGMFPEEKIYLVLGGFHHPPGQVVGEFKKAGVEKVAPSHCSGDEIRELFKEEYQNDFIENGVGKIINIE
jgi:7,8-dihydropterin-6-yl-methyl-4-(beta-D-ribofuranosyl)aminobenzene 5'-phosphate synthase